MATTWNPADKDAAVTLSSGNMSATSSVGAGPAVRSTESRSSGKIKFEILVGAVGSGAICGFMLGASSLTTGPGASGDTGYGWSSAGAMRSNGVNLGTLTYTTGDVLGFELDFAAAKLYVSKNGAYEFSTNPATAAAFSLTAGAYFAAVSPATSSLITGRFFGSSFSYAPYTGFSAWDIPVSHHLAGAATATATASASLRVAHHLAAAAASIATATASPRSRLHFAAAATAIAAASAALRANKTLAAAAAAQASAVAALRVSVHLAAAATANAGGTAGLRVERPEHHLAADASAISTGTAALAVAHHLSAAATALATASADLRLNITPVAHLAAAAQAVSSATAALELLVHLEGNAQATASAVATLRSYLHLAAEARGNAGGVAALSAEPPPPEQADPAPISMQATRREFGVATPTRRTRSTPEYAFDRRLFSRPN